ncbi:MAG TPA: pentapeptide repeat-containing protein [Hyphomicrobiaceae bacterium]|nr:pentapeptide repeat-containing protein [Hyphomicrobiaceae bacterium]
MNDISRTGLETETPVNPYSLLEAVNRSSGTANTAWLIFVGLMAYLLITVAGVTHKDLLLNTAITLPVLQVTIELTRFFLFAPIVLVLLHLGVVGQLVLLARKTLEFGSSIRMLEISDERTHPLRLELDNFFFVQAMAGPERSRLVSLFLHGMSWLTLVALPLAMLLYIQIVFLPYHDVTITWVQRIAVLADIALLVFIGVFLIRSEISFFRAFLRTSVHHPLGLLVTAALLVVVACFALFVATIPGEAVDRLAITSATERSAIERGGRYVFGSATPAAGASDSDSVLGLFRRNIEVVDQDLVVDKDVSPGEATLNLRNRDLRFARLDRSDLHQADMTGANLDGASLVGTDLRSAVMQCASLDELLLTENRRAARCASARAANFYKARLGEARMAGIDLRGARMEEAQLEGADLSYAPMIGTDFASAQMDRANLSGGVQLQGANFLLASLQGADLSGAKLQMADMANAALQGANLSLASLEGAVLRDADLDGANMQMSRLLGTDLKGARLQGADLSGAVVWRAQPPSAEGSALADMAQLALQPPSEADMAALQAVMARFDASPLKSRLSEGLAPLLDVAQNARWASSADQQQWFNYSRTSEAAMADGYRLRLTDFLSKLMCRSRYASAAVATGVARRSMAQGFKGDVPAIYDRLKATECPASTTVGPRLMRELAAAADVARGQ